MDCDPDRRSRKLDRKQRRGVVQPDVRARDCDALAPQRPIENLAGRADERRVAQVLLVTGLLADEHDPRLGGAATEHRLGGVAIQRAALALLRRRRERRETSPGRNERRGAAALGFDPDSIMRGLANATTPGRRMHPVRLPNGALLIDDCYNANPSSTKAALLTLTHLVKGKGKAIAVLGDMLELGPTELDLHRDVGRFAAGAGLSLLVCFGTRARALGEGAEEAGLPAEHIEYTDDPAEAVRLVQARVRPEDVVLVKGSRGMKMERISDPLAGVQ